MAPFILQNRQDEKKEDSFSNHFLTKFMIPFGAMLIAAIALLTANYTLPNWAIVVVVIYLAIVILAILWKPLAKAYYRFQEKKKHYNFAKYYYPLVSGNAIEFGRLIEDQKTNTLIDLIQNMSRWPEMYSNQVSFDREHIATIRAWLESIQTYLMSHSFMDTTDDFLRTARDLSIVISQYNISCVRIQEKLEQLISQGKIVESTLRQLKREWDLRREAHVHFIRQWEGVTKNINRTFERFCVEYYEPLKTLV